MTVYNMSKMAAGVQPRMLPSGYGVAVISTIALAAALLINDTLNICNIGAQAAESAGPGPFLLTVTLDVDQLDTGAALTLDLGDAGAAQRFIAASTIGQTGGIQGATKAGTVGYQPFATTFNNYPTISKATYTPLVTVHAAPGAWQNGSMRAKIEYTYDP